MAGNGNGAEIKTPGGLLLKVGGPLAILAAAFAGIVYLGWKDRQALYGQLAAERSETDKRYQEVYRELRLQRCAYLLDPAMRIMAREHFQTDADWDKVCKWLEFGRGIGGGHGGG